MANRHTAYAKVFRAFSDEKRLMILELLRNGEKCACIILKDLDIVQSTLSYHMKILGESGIVCSRKEKKWAYYKISEKGCEYAKYLLTNLTTTSVLKMEEDT